MYAPHWNAEAAYVITEYRYDDYIDKKNILKAAMESVGFQTQDILVALNNDLNTTINQI